MINRREVLLFGGLFLGPFAMSSFTVNAETIRLVDPAGEAMENMVVYLQPKHLDGSKSEVAMDNMAAPLEVHQRNKQFTPYITVVQKGYELQFVNDDDITHHIYSAAGPKRFSFKLRKDNATKTMVFDQVGHVSMGCNVHDWMSGHLLVVDTPYFGLTDEMGWVSFENAADADYTLVIWHPQLLTRDNTLSQEVTLPLTKALSITVSALMGDIPSQKSLDDFEFLEGY
ncbi:hypothetical protein Sps_01708 [Shewanella psychrophila]|uniref:Plastocyanin n=2 Tax=Shewanella psychrophila TaxID=225848 RepID=A0A1S6HMZ6_9GAMM|nr:hypothetical protein Sps_01708 [Shewanella psychrophila]